MFEGIQKRPIIGPRYIDKDGRLGSLSQLAVEEAGVYDEGESLASFAISQLSPREREIALKVFDHQQLSVDELAEFAATKRRIEGLLDREQWRQLFLSPHPRMRLQSFVVYYAKLRQLRSLADYRALATRATRMLGRNAKLDDLSSPVFVERWIEEMRSPGTRKIAKAIVSAAKRLVLGGHQNQVSHPVFWSETQVDSYVDHVDHVFANSSIGSTKECDFWALLVLLARDLGLPIEALKDITQRHLCALPHRVSSRAERRLARFDVGLDSRLFDGMSSNVLHRRHKELCWQSSTIEASLTAREHEILSLTIDGFGKKQIQAKLQLSYEQLKHSRMRILKVRNALRDGEQQIVATAIRSGFTTNPNADADQIDFVTNRVAQHQECLGLARSLAAETLGLSIDCAYQRLGPLSFPGRYSSWCQCREWYCRGPLQQRSLQTRRVALVALKKFELLMDPPSMEDVSDRMILEFKSRLPPTQFFYADPVERFVDEVKSKE